MSDNLTTITFSLTLDTETGECAGTSLTWDTTVCTVEQALIIVGAALKIAKKSRAYDAMDTSGRLH